MAARRRRGGRRARELALIRAIQRLQRLARSRMRRTLRRGFNQQATRVAARIAAGLAFDEAFDRLAQLAIQSGMLNTPTDVALDVGRIAGAFVGLDEPLSRTSPVIRALRDIGAERITLINDYTRAQAERHLTLGAAERLGVHELAYGQTERAREVAARTGWRPIRDVVQQTYHNRAEAIAVTEIALGSQHAAHDRYASAGVTHVRIIDGPDCGWTSHDDPDKANGSIRTLDEAQERPLSHPRCRRVSLPLTSRRLSELRAAQRTPPTQPR